MNTYYIVYKWRRPSIGFMDTKTDKESWKIIDTNHDLDTISGLKEFIFEQTEPEFLLVSWRKLSKHI